MRVQLRWRQPFVQDPVTGRVSVPEVGTVWLACGFVRLGTVVGGTSECAAWARRIRKQVGVMRAKPQADRRSTWVPYKCKMWALLLTVCFSVLHDTRCGCWYNVRGGCHKGVRTIWGHPFSSQTSPLMITWGPSFSLQTSPLIIMWGQKDNPSHRSPVLSL